MTTDLPSVLVAAACAAASFVLAFAGPAAAQPGPPPPPSDSVCPAIDEDGVLCAADLMSGNCDGFVAAAERLGGLYRSEPEKLPGSETSLETDIWWGCGKANLADVSVLLVRIGSPRAQILLGSEPYRSLLAASQQAAPSQPLLQAPPLDCDALSTAQDRGACIGVQLDAARTGHRDALERCKRRVPPALLDDLVEDEASFQTLLSVRCGAQAAGYAGDASVAGFVRSRCLVQALQDNTRGMLAAHPACAAPD